MSLPVVVTARNASGLTASRSASIDVTSARGLVSAFDPASDNWQNPGALVIDGQQWFVENSNQAWSLTNPDPYTVRMEVRPGDRWVDDDSSRSEILIVTQFAYRQSFDFSWTMLVEAGALNNPAMAWLVLMQAHGGADQPFSIGLRGERLYVNYNINAVAPVVGGDAYYDPNPITRGRAYAVRVQGLFSTGSDGFLKVWRDGILIADYHGQLGTETGGHYIKFGIYQGWAVDVTRTLAVKYSNIAIEAPPPPPPGPYSLGETAMLPIDDSGNGNLLVAQNASLPAAGMLQSLSFYVATAGGQLRLGVYDATGPGGGPGALKAQTAAFTPVVGWNTKPVVTPVNLPTGTYWLAYLPQSNALHFRNADVAGITCRYYSFAFGSMPATFSVSPNAQPSHWSFYATVNVP